MGFIKLGLMTLSMTFAFYNPFLPAILSTGSSSNSGAGENVQDPSSIEITTTLETQPETEEDSSGYKINKFVEYDLEGYCTISVPESHFTYDSSTSANVYKSFLYMDNKTKLYMSYITDMDLSTDIPGYITIDLAGVDTVTNGKTEEIHGDNVKWMKVPAQSQIDGMNVYVYYTLGTDGTSAFWMRLKASPESDDEQLEAVVNAILDTYSCYLVKSGTVFETPDSGYYKDNEVVDPTKADTSNYQKNESENEVYTSHGGFVENADIEDNWDSLEIIIDGTKFTLPCTLQDFKNAGFDYNMVGIDDDYKTIKPTAATSYDLINGNGTTVTITARNDSTTESASVDECRIVKIKVDKSTFVDIAVKESTSTSSSNSSSESTSSKTEKSYEEAASETPYSKYNKEMTQEEQERLDSLSDDEYAIETGTRRGEKTAAELSNDREAEEDEYLAEIQKELQTMRDTKEAQEASAKQQAESQATSESNSSSTSDSNENNSSKSTSSASTNDTTKYKSHTVILPGGVTWDIYTADLLDYYGTPHENVETNYGSNLRLTWTKTGKYLQVIIGKISQVQVVEISCEDYE